MLKRLWIVVLLWLCGVILLFAGQSWAETTATQTQSTATKAEADLSGNIENQNQPGNDKQDWSWDTKPSEDDKWITGKPYSIIEEGKPFKPKFTPKGQWISEPGENDQWVTGGEGKFLSPNTPNWQFDTRTDKDSFEPASDNGNDGSFLIPGQTRAITPGSFSQGGKGEFIQALQALQEQGEDLSHLGQNINQLMQQNQPRSVAYHPKKTLIAVGTERGHIELWDTEKQARTTTLRGHTNTVNSLAFSNDGQMLASGSSDHSIRLWGLSGNSRNSVLLSKGHNGAIYSVAFANDGNTLASASSDNTIKIWNIQQQKLDATLQGHTSRVTSVAFANDDKTLASASYDNTIKIWNIDTQQNRSLPRPPVPSISPAHSINHIAISPDSKTLASASNNGTIKIWNIQQQKLDATLQGHASPVTSVAFTTDGKTLASTSYDSTIKIWNIQQQKLLATLQGCGLHIMCFMQNWEFHTSRFSPRIAPNGPQFALMPSGS